MLKILKTILPSQEWIKEVAIGMRNPMNSWKNSDTPDAFDNKTIAMPCVLASSSNSLENVFTVGEKDLDLMSRLSNQGPVHSKYKRMIPLLVTIDAPLYWWKEFDTYKIGTVANSCSTMHKMHEKEFNIDMFSHDHLTKLYVEDGDKSCPCYPFEYGLFGTIRDLNLARKMFLSTKNKDYWNQMVQLLPSSFNQTRTVMLNYEVLTSIYTYRHSHKLDEWITFCDWVKTLPYANELLILKNQLEISTWNCAYDASKNLNDDTIFSFTWKYGDNNNEIYVASFTIDSLLQYIEYNKNDSTIVPLYIAISTFETIDKKIEFLIKYFGNNEAVKYLVINMSKQYKNLENWCTINKIKEDY